MATAEKTNVKSINDTEIKALKKDYAELKDLMSKIQEDLKVAGNKKISDLQENSLEKLENIEAKISRNPRKAVTYAFLAGVVASIVLRR